LFNYWFFKKSLQKPFFSGLGGYFLVLEEISCCVLEIINKSKIEKISHQFGAEFSFLFYKFCDIKNLVNVLDKIAK
jgi:hypothetical protein